uniref:Protein pelota homolog n=1 Tax=Panagrellus redivivus TaxID=6233 RepID=A0A7E4W6C3_PANRE
MKIIYRNIERDGSGVVKVQCEEQEDMWHLYNIIRVGDHVRSKTFRKVANESQTRSKTSQRITLTLEIDIETIDFDQVACALHVKGRNVLENEHVRLGAYHTIDIELHRAFYLKKVCWDSIDMQRLEEASDPSKSAEVAAVVMHEGLANICVITSTMTVVKAKIEMNVARKRKGFSSQHDKGVDRFLDAVAQAFLRHIDMNIIKVVIVASRGFLRDQFMTQLFNIADKQNKRFSSTDKSKFVVVPSSSGFKHSLKDILADASVCARLADTKAQEEVKALNTFMELLNNDSARAFYGFKHVSMANEKCAVDTLMVSDALFRSHDVLQRKEYVKLVESVKSQNGNVLIFSSMHVSGEQLNQITGVAAILRFPLPEIENEDMDDEDEIVEEPIPPMDTTLDHALEEIHLDDDEEDFM